MGRFPFKKNSGLKFRKLHVPNGTVHSYCTDTPNASHRAFGYCSCKQDTKEQFWGQRFCQMERDISVRPTEMTRPVKDDYLQSWSWIYPSDQTEMVRSIDVSTEISGILGWIESAHVVFCLFFFCRFPSRAFFMVMPSGTFLLPALSSNGPMKGNEMAAQINEAPPGTTQCNLWRQEEPAILTSGLLLRMRRMYVASIHLDFHWEKTQCDHVRFDLLPLVIWSRMFIYAKQ